MERKICTSLVVFILEADLSRLITDIGFLAILTLANFSYQRQTLDSALGGVGTTALRDFARCTTDLFASDIG